MPKSIDFSDYESCLKLDETLCTSEEAAEFLGITRKNLRYLGLTSKTAAAIGKRGCCYFLWSDVRKAYRDREERECAQAKAEFEAAGEWEDGRELPSLDDLRRENRTPGVKSFRDAAFLEHMEHRVDHRKPEFSEECERA